MKIKVSAGTINELRHWAHAADPHAKGTEAYKGTREFLAQTVNNVAQHRTLQITPSIRRWLSRGGKHSDPMTAAGLLEEWVKDGMVPSMAPHLTRQSARRIAGELRRIYEQVSVSEDVAANQNTMTKQLLSELVEEISPSMYEQGVPASYLAAFIERKREVLTSALQRVAGKRDATARSRPEPASNAPETLSALACGNQEAPPFTNFHALHELEIARRSAEMATERAPAGTFETARLSRGYAASAAEESAKAAGEYMSCNFAQSYSFWRAVFYAMEMSQISAEYRGGLDLQWVEINRRLEKAEIYARREMEKETG